MRILRIGILNLNSLVGRHEIDFREEPLSATGLYAIVGPTGAGKSTILDAVTLALYGQTERDRVGADVMSHGSGDCFAEVEYEATGGTYLSRWERRRARGKADGNLQTAQRQLSRWAESERRYVPMPADRLSAVNEMTVDIVGLDYDQFVRSVMLTQGQFARFLVSKTSERAAILEKVTGTEVYSRISSAAFERHKEARQRFDSLTESRKFARPLGEEERSALEAGHMKINDEILHLRPRQKELQEGVERHARIERAQTQDRELKEREAELARRKEELAHTRNAFGESQRLHPLREPLQRQDQLQQTLTEFRKAVEREQREWSDLQAAEKQAQRTFEKVQQEIEAFEKEKPARQRLLLRAAELENQLTVLEREEQANRPILRAAEQKVDRLNATLAELTARGTQLRRQLGGKGERDLPGEIEKTEARLETLRKRIEQLSQWTRFRRTQERVAELDQLYAVRERELTEATGKVEAMAVAVGNARDAVSDRRDMLGHLERSLQLKDYRADLRKGEPCPLCGSTHHPLLENGAEPATESQLQRAKSDLTTAEKELEQAREADRRAGGQLATLRAQIGELRDRMRQLSAEEREQRPDGMPPEGTAEELEREQQQMSIQKGETAANLTTLRQLRKVYEQLRILDTQLQTAEREWREADAEVARLRKVADIRSGKQERLRKSLHDLIGEGTVAAHRTRFEQEEDRLRNAVLAANERVKAAGTRREVQAERVRAGEQEVARRQAEYDALHIEIADLLRQLDVATPQLALERLLHPEQEEKFRTALRQLELTAATLVGQRQQLDTELDKLRTALEEIPAREELQMELATLEAQQQELAERLGGLKKQLEDDDARREVYRLQGEELERAERELFRWAKLNELIGQQDGVKFSRFAQSLTLKRLVEVGNRHLLQINDRYRMEHRASDNQSQEKLELEIIDTYQNDNRRPMSTLSGGETFLVSLALALGLSELASGRTNIQSVFIDEGFGTLDEETLDQAISALERLQAQGKTIGLISHVRELRERIHCQIQLRRRGNGRSSLRVVPT